MCFLKSKKLKQRIVLLLTSVVISILCMFLFSNKYKIAIESMAVSPSEEYIAYFLRGDGYKICCEHTDGISMFSFDIPTDISAGGFCSLWFDNDSLYAFFYRTNKVVCFALDGTVQCISESTEEKYPPEFPSFTHKGSKYVFQGKYVNVVYNERTFWDYWILDKERYVAVLSKANEVKFVYIWTAEEGIQPRDGFPAH